MPGPKKKTPAIKDPKKKPEETETEETEETEGEDELNERINAVVTSHTKRLEKKIGKQFDELKALLVKTEPDTDADEPDTDADEPAAKTKDADTRRLEKRVAAAEKKAQAAEQREREQAEKARSSEERSLVAGALTKAGVTNPALHEAALALLFSKGQVMRDEAGHVRVKGKDKYQLEAVLDVDSGVAQWLKAEGKAFLPPADAGGSGASPSLGAGGDTLTRTEFAKLDKAQQARIEIERASVGLPPLGA